MVKKKKLDNKDQPLLFHAMKEAEDELLNTEKTEEMFTEIEKTYHCTITRKDKALFYLIATNKYTCEELANKVYPNRKDYKSIRSDFSKGLGHYLKLHFELELEDEYVAITSLVRILKNRGFYFNRSTIEQDEKFVNILGKRYSENFQLEGESISRNIINNQTSSD